MEVNRSRALHVTEGEGKTLWVADELMTFKATADDTGGAYSLTDSVVPPGGGPPPHIHHREDEAFWVLEGELEVMVGESTFKAGPGSFVHLPKDVPHSYENIGPGAARFLTLMVPGGVEKFFEEVGKPGSDVSSPPPFEEEDIEKFLAIAPKYGAEILPPPRTVVRSAGVSLTAPALFMLSTFPKTGYAANLLSENKTSQILGERKHPAALLLPQHVGSRLTKSLPFASAPC